MLHTHKKNLRTSYGAQRERANFSITTAIHPSQSSQTHFMIRKNVLKIKFFRTNSNSEILFFITIAHTNYVNENE